MRTSRRTQPVSRWGFGGWGIAWTCFGFRRFALGDGCVAFDGRSKIFLIMSIHDNLIYRAFVEFLEGEKKRVGSPKFRVTYPRMNSGVSLL
jgi:hypothetical protein